MAKKKITLLKGYTQREAEQYFELRGREYRVLNESPASSTLLVRYPSGWYSFTIPASIINVAGFIKMWEVKQKLRKEL